MSGHPEPRWWRRQRDLALIQARDAKARAAIALLHLDTEQRSAATHLDFIAGVDAGPTGERLRTAWTPVSQAADDAIRAYLEAAAHWDVSEDLELEVAAAAATAFAGHADAMRAAMEEISAYAQRSTADFVRVTQTLEQLAEQRGRTEQALAAAHGEIERAEHGGLLCRRARQLLQRGLERFRVVEQGAPQHGMQEVLLACDEVVTIAASATAAVRELPELREKVRTGTLSLSTRRSALEWRAGQGSDDVLRTLRRDFVLTCSQDLDDAAARAQAALERAGDALDEAGGKASATEQRWDEALAALEEARSQLDVAQEHVEAPQERLSLVQSVAADPAGYAGAARFAVRDAQQLLMAGPVEPRHAQQLDAIAARLERTDDGLDRPHPDWLTYAHTLDAIIDSARGLVVDIRASRAR